jgi:putative sterol carrier protein
MARYDQAWCDELGASVGGDALLESAPMRLLYVVSDTEDGKVAFHLELDRGGVASVTAGKLPRGEKADVTVTAKEVVLSQLWQGDQRRDVAFMRGDLKVEGEYARWLDELVPLFEKEPWSTAWKQAVR